MFSWTNDLFYDLLFFKNQLFILSSIYFNGPVSRPYLYPCLSFVTLFLSCLSFVTLFLSCPSFVTLFLSCPSFVTFNEPVMDHMLLGLKGTTWKAVRSVMTPTFSSGKVKHTLQLVKDCAKNLVTYFNKEMEKG